MANISIFGNMGRPIDSTDPIKTSDLKKLEGTILIHKVAFKSISGLEYAPSIDTLIINELKTQIYFYLNKLFPHMIPLVNDRCYNINR